MSLIRHIKLKTWIGIGIIVVLLPIAVFRAIYGAIAAPPVANTRWTFDDAQGTTAQDYSSNDNDGTVTGATWVETDRCIDGNCLNFDGADDRVSRADDADFDFAAADSFTVSFWYKSPPKTALSVLAVKLEAVGTDGGYIIQQEADGDITCAIEDDDADTTIDITISSTAANYDDNRWHHVACVKNGTTSLTLYIDSQQIVQDTGLGSVTTLENDETFYLGADNGGTTNEFTGFVDEFRMYRSALTSAQIIVDFNFGAAARFKDQPSDFLTDGLVGYWKMEEAGDATRTDSSGNGTTLTESAADTVAQVGGKFGNAGDFEAGDTEYLSAADNAALSITGSLTLSAWIRPETVGAGGYNIIAKWDNGNNSYRFFQDGDDLELVLDNAGNSLETTGNYLTALAFHHVVAVYDAPTASIKFYINGVEATSTNLNGTIPSSIGDDAGAFHIGAQDSSSTPSNYYDGYIDEARVYNRALSPAEVKSLYNWAPGPVGHWKLDENTGTTSVVDSSGNGTDLTMVGSMTSNDWITGKYGAALDFDGSNDLLDDGVDTEILDMGTKNFTVMAWVWRDTATTNDGILNKRSQALGSTCTVSQDVGYQIIIYDTDELALGICDTNLDGMEMFTAANAVSTGGWHHIAAVVDRSSRTICITNGNCRIYIDGVNVAVTYAEEVLNTFPTASLSNGNSFNIATDVADPTIDNPFDGRIDDVRIYNYARTAQQIIEDMNAGHPAGGSPIASQAVLWKFDEQFGVTAQDLADTVQSDGTISGATWLTSTSCKMNGCLSFDGINDVVTIATTSETEVDFNGSEKFSLSAWIYSTTVPNTTTDEDLIIGKWDETNSLRTYRMFLENDDTDSTGNIRVEVMDESTVGNEILSAQTANDSISQNTWYHVVMTFGGTTTGAADSLKVYLDGKLISSNSANASFLGIEDLASDFTVGDYDTNDSDTDLDAFTGRIDHVEVYSDELTPDQVKIVMNAGSAASYGVLATTSEEADVAGSQGNAPVGWWTFNEGTDNTCSGGSNDVCDRSSNSNDGGKTNMAASNWVPGKLGQAMNFDGDDDFLSTNLNLVETAAYSASMWVYPRTLTNDDTFWCLARSGDSCEGALYYNTNVIRWCNDSTCVNEAVTNTSVLSTNAWNHISAVYDGSGTAAIYVNGVNVTSDSSVGESSLTNAGFSMGNNGILAPNGIDGYIDEVKVYDYARSAAQVTYDFNRGGPSLWYKLDENTGTNANDLSTRADLGSALDGTITGVGWTSGKINYSLDFDGVDDVISRANDNAIDLNVGLANGFTIATWIYPNSDGEGDAGRIWQKAADGQTTDASINGCRTVGESGGLVTVTCRLDLATTDATVTASPTIPINQWSHIALSWTNDGDDEITVWVNGTPTASTDGSGNPNADTFSLFIGGNGSTTNDRAFDGQIDDFRIYPFEITSALQIKKIMNDGSIGRFGPATGSP